jgi:hypothetical protein
MNQTNGFRSFAMAVFGLIAFCGFAVWVTRDAYGNIGDVVYHCSMATRGCMAFLCGMLGMILTDISIGLRRRG